MPVQATPGRTAARRRPRRHLLVRRLLALCLLVLATAGGVGLAFAGSPDVLPAGATIAGVDVAGMRRDDALATLEARARALERRPVAFVAGSSAVSLSAAQLGVRADWRRAVEDAAGAGAGFGPLRGLRRLRLRLSGDAVEPQVAWYRGAVDYAVASLADEVLVLPVAARLRVRAGGVTIVPGRAGRALDRVAAGRRIVAALGALDRPERVVLPVTSQPPAVTEDALRGALARTRTALSAPVRLRSGATAITIRPRELAQLLRLPRDGDREVAIGGRAAERWFERLAGRLARAPRDAGWEVADGGRVRVIPAIPGSQVDIPATVARLEREAFSRSDRTAAVVLRDVEPERTTDAARDLGIREVVASYTTTYGGTPGRLHNVQLVAGLIDGALVAPGATFSFNEVTGERNAAKGFAEATVIISGELRSGIGGGVCQVSTTVFNAAFEAGLPIVERTNHALYIAHYPLGRDATVNYPDIDLRFVNDTGGWLLVRTTVGAGALTVRLLGRSPHRRVETETAPLVATGKTPFRLVRDRTLPPRTRIVEQQGTHPRQTSVRRRVYDADGTLLSDRVWLSTYAGEPTIVRVGRRKPVPRGAPGAVSGTPAPAPSPRP